MNYSKIRLLGPSVVDLPIRGATPDGPYVLKDADLGSPTVDVFITRTRSGSVYGGRQPQNKEISVTVGLQPNWTVGQSSADLRDALYELLTPKYGAMIRVQVLNEVDEVIAEISGHVRLMEPLQFTNEPQVRIYIPTMSPYFTGNQIVSSPPMTVDGTDTIITVDNVGNAPAPFFIAIQFVTGHALNLVRFGEGTPAGQELIIDRNFDANDILIVNTIPGQRGVWKLNESISADWVPILSTLRPASDFMEMHAGINTLTVNNNNIQWTALQFSYTPRYWGF